MLTIANQKITTAQLLGGCLIILSLIMGVLGAFCLKKEIALPEYMTCLRNTGWSLLIISSVWTGLAFWKQR